MKKVLITGGNKGIGLETTKLFLEAGYKVIVVARDFSGFSLKDNENVEMIEFDVSRISEIETLAQKVGYVDVIPEARKAAMKANTYTNRFAKPEEIAKTVFWLGTDSPEYINGVCMDLNNGSFTR